MSGPSAAAIRRGSPPMTVTSSPQADLGASQLGDMALDPGPSVGPDHVHDPHPLTGTTERSRDSSPR